MPVLCKQNNIPIVFGFCESGLYFGSFAFHLYSKYTGIHRNNRSNDVAGPTTNTKHKKSSKYYRTTGNELTTTTNTVAVAADGSHYTQLPNASGVRDRG